MSQPTPETITIRVTPRILALLGVIADANTRAPAPTPNPERTTPGEPITLEEAAALALNEGACSLVVQECQRQRHGFHMVGMVPGCMPQGPAYLPRNVPEAQTFGLPPEG